MPLDTTVKHYTNTMNSAPSLINTANSMIALLDAVLINGFGTQNVTSLSVTSNVATANVSGGYIISPRGVVTISGATPSELNGDKKILSNTATSFTFEANGVSDQVATGTITVRFPGAGWTKPFAGTNLAVYKNSANVFFRVDDSSTTVTRIVGYETMTDVNTGTNPFPLPSQLSGGIYLSKANNSTPKRWWVVADSKMFYISTAPFSSYPNSFHSETCMGTYKTFKAGDNYNHILTGLNTDRSGANDGRYESAYNSGRNDLFQRYYLCRPTTQIPGSRSASLYFFGNNLVSEVVSGYNGYPYPNLPNGALYYTPQYIVEAGVGFRGILPGLYLTYQNISIDNLTIEHDTLFDSIPSSDRKACYKGTNAGIYAGAFFIDVTGPWDY